MTPDHKCACNASWKKSTKWLQLWLKYNAEKLKKNTH